MKKFVVAIVFKVLLMVQLFLLVSLIEVDVDAASGTFEVSFPYLIPMVLGIVLTLVVNHFIYRKLDVARPQDMPLIMVSNDEREQSIINRFAIYGFIYFTPIIILIGALTLPVLMLFIDQVSMIIRLFGYFVILALGLPFIIHALCVIFSIRRV